MNASGQAGRDTWSLAFAFGEIISQRTIVLRLLAGAFEPRHVISVLYALQEFFIVLDGDDDGDGLAFARDDFRFGQRCFHGGNLSGGRSGVKLTALLDDPARLFFHCF